MWDDMDWGSMVRKVVPRPEPEPAPPAEAAEPEKPVVEARAAVSTPPAPTPPPLPVDEKLAMLPRAEDSAPERAPRNESRGPATVGLSAADRFVYAPQTAATFTFCTPEGVEQGTPHDPPADAGRVVGSPGHDDGGRSRGSSTEEHRAAHGYITRKGRKLQGLERWFTCERFAREGGVVVNSRIP